MHPPASRKPPRNVLACPVCGLRMHLITRQNDHVSVGCDECGVSMSLPAGIWQVAKTELEGTAPSQ